MTATFNNWSGMRVKRVAVIATAVAVAMAVALSRPVAEHDASVVSVTEEGHSPLPNSGEVAGARPAIPHEDESAAGRSVRRHDNVETLSQSLEAEPEEDARRYLALRFARLDARLADSLPDPKWNPVKDVVAYVSRVDPASQVIYSQCADELCKFTITHAANEGKRRFRSRLDPSISMPWAVMVEADSTESIDVFAGGVLINDYDDAGATYLYVSRPGRNFGDPPVEKNARDRALLAAQKDLLRQMASTNAK